ncbi:uncharacterized protein LOC110981871 [Acanthaster planci]|uniref:Uncharacterized protein LOC110981871 n=1 Tax=Acanthaster planci TaxID=133434 RepID=A0A8B7YSV3_ACAPL|nr:uncharacterized protein LOC110981871 [Acanthaster planci]
MSVFHLTSRLVQAQHASSPTQHQEEEGIKAGRSAEIELINALKQQGIPSSHIFRGLRVPDGFQTRKYEIDLVVLTDYGLFTVEVKNWSGKVSLGSDGKSWIHHKCTYSDKNSSVSYDEKSEDLITTLKLKTQLLRNHLLRKDVCLAEKYFHPRVVFMNKKLEIQDELVSKLEVVSSLRYQVFLQSFQKGFGWSVASAIIPSFITGQLSYGAMEMARQGLNTIGTWDVISLNGDRQLYGDFKGNAHFSPNREETAMLEFSHQRNAAISSLWAVLGYSPQVVITMHKRSGGSWLWGTSCGSVTIPYNAEIMFRVAGDQEDSKIPANDIQSISLSI